MTDSGTQHQDPHHDPEFQAWAKKMAQQCTSQGADRPCGGCLAGGMCDNLHAAHESEWTDEEGRESWD